MKSNHRILVLLLSFYTTLVISQNCTHTFSGIVEDFHDKSAIVGATVYLKNLNKYAVTDIDGKFKIPNLCSGTIEVEVSHISCETKIFKFDLTKDIYKVIDLEHHIEELDEISVKAATGIKTKTSQETLLKTNTLENFSDASLGDALKEVSGVSSINTGSAIVKPVINGLHSSRVLTSVNGVRLQDQDWGIEHAPNVDINAAGSISVIKGASALEYGGDAIGGVIVINPSKIIRKDTLMGKTIVSQQNNGRLFSINTNLSKTYEKGWFINGQASFKRSGDFMAPDYNLTNTGIKSYGFSLNGGFKNFNKGFDIYYSYLSNELGILRASHIGTAGDLVRAINSGIPLVVEDFSYAINNPKQDVTHQLLKAKMYKRLKGVGKFSIQYDFQHNRRLEFDIRRGGRSGIAAADLALTTHSVTADIKLDSDPDNIYKFGISGGYQNNFPRLTGVRRIIPDYDKFNTGIYAISEFRFNGFLLSAGIRYDFNHINAKKFYLKSRWNSLNYDQDFSNIIIEDTGTQYLVNPKFNYHNVSASTGLLYELDSKNSFIVNYGLSNRAPNPSELFSEGLHHAAARIELGNLRIQPETSHRFSGTYKYTNSKFNVSVEAFFNHIKDFIYLEPTGTETTLRGTFVVWAYQQVNANLFGIDTNVSFDVIDNLTIANKSSLLKGRDASNNRPLIDIPPFKTVSSITYEKKSWNNFYASLQSEFNARQNEYPDNNFTTFVPSTNSNELVDISTPPNAYHLLNFSTGLDFNLSNTTIGINFSIDNMLNTSYRNYLNRLRFFADDLGRNFKLQIKINY
ncbi:TonB-dependent receptor [Tenacibaculum amylolyticum]|uniref:TonB-dependent receptor n=1 Tax=Tenacibaculum amylolyticum TaxID=104269 RepID=UPI0038936939